KVTVHSCTSSNDACDGGAFISQLRRISLLVNPRRSLKKEIDMANSKTPKTWFITGASSGFGSEFAKVALERGDNVVATARSVTKLEALVALAPDRVLAQKMDVTDHADIQAAVDSAVRRFGR